MNKDEMIDNLWEQSNHGTRREDVVAAWEAGAAAEREACAKVCEKLYEPNDYWEDGKAFAAAVRGRSNV